MRIFQWFVLISLFLSLGSACYSLRGISISPNVQTFYVANFQNRTVSGDPAMPQRFTEKLKDKIRIESRLTYNDVKPDVEFNGSMVDFTVSSVAPQPGEQSAINRLTMAFQVNFINNQDTTANFRQNFSFFQDYPGSTNLLSVQDQLTEAIMNQLTEDIFNKAFANW
ncbi:MAG: LPS assembly lipoprotein LptE [Saprospiraceae bacterium]